MHSVDLAIVGGGTAGISAGLRALELGLSTVILERGQEIGGAAGIRLSGGAFHLALGDMRLDHDPMLAHVNKVTNQEIAPAIAEMIANRSKSSIAWLQKQGVELVPQGNEFGYVTIYPRGPSVPGRGFNRKAAPDKAMRTWHFRFVEQGGTIYYGARAKSLKPAPGGKGWIVEASSSEPEGLRVQAQSVILADGGFQANPKLLEKYLGPRASKSALRAMTTASGDGLTMALEQGGYVAGEGRGVYGHILHRNAITDENFLPYPMFDALCLASPVVDAKGRLFKHGAKDGPELTYKMLMSSDPAGYTIIMDNATWTGPAANGGGYHPAVNPAIEQKGGRVDSAPTLAEAARKAGMDEKELAASVEKFNATAKAKLGSGPYYAVPISAGVTFTFPGIAVNEKAEVVRKGGGAIVGLYAAGCATGGIHGRGGGGGYLGGLGIALITGMLAAEGAAARKKA